MCVCVKVHSVYFYMHKYFSNLTCLRKHNLGLEVGLTTDCISYSWWWWPQKGEVREGQNQERRQKWPKTTFCKQSILFCCSHDARWKKTRRRRNKMMRLNCCKKGKINKTVQKCVRNKTTGCRWLPFWCNRMRVKGQPSVVGSDATNPGKYTMVEGQPTKAQLCMCVCVCRWKERKVGWERGGYRGDRFANH